MKQGNPSGMIIVNREDLVMKSNKSANHNLNNQTLKGIVLITLAILGLSVMDALVKWMVMQDNHPVQLLAVRGWIILLFFSLLIFQRGTVVVRTSSRRLHLIRGLIGACAPILFFLALKTLPLAEATALFFSSTFMMTGLSAWFLKEPVGFHRWTAVVIGFCGVLMITRPGAEAFRIEALYVFVASLAYAILVVSGRWLTRTDSALSLVFYFNLALVLICTAALPWIWQPMAPQIWLGIVGFAVLALLGHLGIAQAFKIAPIGVIAPFEYMALVWATLLGFLIWQDLPSAYSFAGMLVIIFSGIYILHRERVGKSSASIDF